ncbi:MAG: BamA/TamA family outer membrane protein, partial [Bacteroidia bacterium]|nr:BamA/TamA family outer membrane protein [Bacteroidia bacterium]
MKLTVLVWIVLLESWLPAFAQYQIVGLPERLHRRFRKTIHQASLDSFALLTFREKSTQFLRQQGFAEIQSTWNGKELTFSVGKRYYWKHILIQGLAPELYQKAGFFRLVKHKLPFLWSDLQLRSQSLLQDYENRGFPFAQFKIDSLNYQMISGEIAVSLYASLEPGKEIRIDSVVTDSSIRERNRFLEKICRIENGDLFRQEAIAAIPRLLNNSPYYQNVCVQEIIYTDKGAKIKLSVQRKRSNRFDALVGLLPPQDNTQKFQFTGLLDLMLVSPLRQGEILSLRYEKLTGSSQKLEFSYKHPFLLGLPVSAGVRFSLLKQDTLFLTRNLEINGSWLLSSILTTHFFYRNQVSNLLSAATWKNKKWPPPPVLDATAHSYGIGFGLDNLDYALNPQKGWYLQTDFSIGNKTIRKTRGLDSLDYSRIQLNLPRQEIRLQVSHFQRLFRRQVLMLAVKGYWLVQPEYFDNDQLLIGGGKNLRGFNENQFLTRRYTLFTAEYRYLLERNSYVTIFSDWAWLEYAQIKQIETLHPFGIGVGFQFETGIGILSISYAAGQTEQQP